MPEEVNRIVCDQLSSILFAPTITAIENLRREGFDDSMALFANGRKRIVKNSGDVMYDNSLHYSQISSKYSSIIKDLQIESGNYILSTIHRNNNTDEPIRLEAIVNALLDIAETRQINVVLPLHPRTNKILPQNLTNKSYTRLQKSKWIKIIPPASFYEIIELEKNARIVMTDSGGIQKEAFFFEKPCVILRSETEWVEIVKHKAGIVTDANYLRIIEAYEILENSKISFPPLLGDCHAANHILNSILTYL